MCEGARCDSPMRARAVCKLSTLTDQRQHDGKIEEVPPEGAKPLTCLAPSGGVGRLACRLQERDATFQASFQHWPFRDAQRAPLPEPPCGRSPA